MCEPLTAVSLYKINLSSVCETLTAVSLYEKEIQAQCAKPFPLSRFLKNKIKVFGEILTPISHSKKNKFKVLVYKRSWVCPSEVG